MKLVITKFHESRICFSKVFQHFAQIFHYYTAAFLTFPEGIDMEHEMRQESANVAYNFIL